MATYEVLTHNTNNQATGGIWRVTDGPYGDAVYKVCTPTGAGTWETSNDPRHWNFWRREVYAYETGLVNEAFGDIVGPRLLAIDELDDGARGLWLEDVRGTPGFEWTTERLGVFARRLGEAQARHAKHGLPDLPWLSSQWLRQYVSSKPLNSIPWDHPRVTNAWPADLLDGLKDIWNSRRALIGAVERGPRTLCHLDVWPMNLIAADDRMVLVDWSFIGDGAIGEDTANLILDCVFDGRMPVESLTDIDAAVTDGYIGGLTRGGWTGSADDVRASIAVAGAARYCWLAPFNVIRLAEGAPLGSAAYDAHGGDDTVIERRARIFEHLISWANQAR